MPYATVRQRQLAAVRGTWISGSPIPLRVGGTRFYCPQTGAAPVSPAYDAGWEETGDADRISLVTARINSAMTTKSITALLSVADTLFRQYISAALEAQTISGTVKAQFRAQEGLVTSNAVDRISIRVVSNDGGTVRGTLLAIGGAGPQTEWATALTNRTFADGDALSSVVAEAGDRLVIEIGANHAAVIDTLSMSFGDDNATDLPEDESTTSAFNPWVEFSQVLTFQQALPPGINGSLWQDDFDSPPRYARALRLRRPNEGWVWPQQSNLLGQDRFFGDPGQFSIITTPHPYLRRVPLRNAATIPGAQILEGQDRVYGDPGQVPTFGVTERQRSRPPLIQQYEQPGARILIGQDQIYGDPGQAPMYEWLVPAHFLRVPAIDLRTWAQGLVNTTLLGQDTIYGAAGQAPMYEWLVPAHFVRPHPAELRTWLQSLTNGALAGQDVFYGDVGQAITFGLTQPQRTLRPFQQDIAALGTDRLIAAAGDPFIPWDLALPVRTVPVRPEQRSWLMSLVNSTLAAQDSFYGDPGQAVTFGITERQRSLTPAHQYHVTAGGLILLGQDAVYADPGQAVMFGVTERQRARPPLHQSHTVPGGFILAGQDTFYAEQGQSITFGVSERQRSRPPLTPQWEQAGGQMLTGQDVIYGDPGQAPGISAAPRWVSRPVFTQDWTIGGINPLYVGEDTLYAGPGQVQAFDTPLPRRAPRLTQDMVMLGTDRITVVEPLPAGLPQYDPPLLRPGYRVPTDYTTMLVLLTVTPEPEPQPGPSPPSAGGGGGGMWWTAVRGRLPDLLKPLPPKPKPIVQHRTGRLMLQGTLSVRLSGVAVLHPVILIAQAPFMATAQATAERLAGGWTVIDVTGIGVAAGQHVILASGQGTAFDDGELEDLRLLGLI